MSIQRQISNLNFDPSLYFVLDPAQLLPTRTLEDTLEEALSGGVTLLQLRDKTCSDGELINLVRRIVPYLNRNAVPLIINDRVQVAKAVGAAGVHLGQKDLHWKLAREVLGRDAIIGVSVENCLQAEVLEGQSVSYLGVSAIFQSSSKEDVSNLWGLEGLRQLRLLSSHCLVGIGGINESNAASVIKAGADGVAVVSALSRARDPMGVSAEIRARTNEAKVCRREDGYREPLFSQALSHD